MSTNFDCSDSTSLHVMLSELQCPYQVDNQAMCSFYRREDFCPFGHRSHHNDTLSAIPPNICADYLVGKCIHDGTRKIPIEDGWLTRCSVGYHPTWTQLIDLEQLDQVLQEADNELKCAICLERMHSPFGLLEHCCHLFCAECIIEWQETDRLKRCPVCRVHSPRVLPLTSTDPILKEQTKLELFRLQARCIDLFHDRHDGNQDWDFDLYLYLQNPYLVDQEDEPLAQEQEQALLEQKGARQEEALEQAQRELEQRQQEEARLRPHRMFKQVILMLAYGLCVRSLYWLY